MASNRLVGAFFRTGTCQKRWLLADILCVFCFCVTIIKIDYFVCKSALLGLCKCVISLVKI